MEHGQPAKVLEAETNRIVIHGAQDFEAMRRAGRLGAGGVRWSSSSRNGSKAGARWAKGAGPQQASPGGSSAIGSVPSASIPTSSPPVVSSYADRAYASWRQIPSSNALASNRCFS